MKKKQIKKFKVPIFTEEYSVWVYVGSLDLVETEALKYGVPKEYIMDHSRGRTFRMLPEKHPLIIVNGDLPASVAISTLAHEASHAVDYIADYVGVNDTNGEFRGHGISAICRAVLKTILNEI